MKALTKKILLYALLINFIMMLAIVVFTEINWNDTWVLMLYAVIALLTLWIGTAKVENR